MSNNTPSGGRRSVIPWPRVSEIDCEACREELGDYIRQLLIGSQPRQEVIPIHLESCPSCSRVYLDLLELMTATQVRQLIDSWLDPKEAPPKLILESLLSLWQMQLGAAERVNDLKAAARGLSILGLIRRQLDDVEEARLVHELALQTAEESRDLLSRMISSADLGYIALSSNQVREAKNYLEAAQNYAVQLQATESAIRIRLLLSRTRGMKWQALKQIYQETIDRTKMDYEAALKWCDEMIQTALKPDLLGQKFMAGLLGPQLFLATPAGERALVVNTVSEVPIKIVDPKTGNALTGFKLDVTGHVTFGLRLTSFPTPPQTFYIDVLFVPTSTVICQQTIGPQERVWLKTMKGLKFDCDLSLSDEFLKEWQQRLQLKNWESILLPKTAFALRVWWD